MFTTLNEVRKHSPCGIDPRDTPLTGYQKLVTYLGKGFSPDAPVSIATIIDSNGLGDAQWCLRAVSGCNKEIRLYAVWCARQVEHLEKTDAAKNCNDVAARFACGKAAQQELNAARAAANAAWAANAARAARAAAWDAWDAAWAAQEKELRRICVKWEAENAR